MREEIKLRIVLIAAVLLLVVVNYPFLDNALKSFLEDYEVGVVERVVDGDTVIVEGESIRLLGINSPEKNEPYYIEAKEYLEVMVLNRTIKMKKGKEDRDLYNRKLRYLFVGLTNINQELVKQGLANFYFPAGKNSYYGDFKNTWEDCIEKKVNLCEASKAMCAPCIELKKFDHREEEIVLYNRCSFNCDLEGWQIKDEGRKKFTLPGFKLVSHGEVSIKVGEGENSDEVLFWNRGDYVWTETGDTLFLRDSDGKLVLWESY